MRRSGIKKAAWGNAAGKEDFWSGRLPTAASSASGSKDFGRASASLSPAVEDSPVGGQGWTGRGRCQGRTPSPSV